MRVRRALWVGVLAVAACRPVTNGRCADSSQCRTGSVCNTQVGLCVLATLPCTPACTTGLTCTAGSCVPLAPVVSIKADANPLLSPSKNRLTVHVESDPLLTLGLLAVEASTATKVAVARGSLAVAQPGDQAVSLTLDPGLEGPGTLLARVVYTGADGVEREARSVSVPVQLDSKGPLLGLSVLAEGDQVGGWVPRTSGTVTLVAQVTDLGAGPGGATLTFKTCPTAVSVPCTATGALQGTPSQGLATYAFVIPRFAQEAGAEARLDVNVEGTDAAGNTTQGTGKLLIDDKAPVVSATPVLVSTGVAGEDGHTWFPGKTNATLVELSVAIADAGVGYGAAEVSLALVAADLDAGQSTSVAGFLPSPADGTVHFKIPTDRISGREGKVRYSILAKDKLGNQAAPVQNDATAIWVDDVPPHVTLATTSYDGAWPPIGTVCGRSDAGFVCGRAPLGVADRVLRDDRISSSFYAWDCGAGIDVAHSTWTAETGGQVLGPAAADEWGTDATRCTNGSPNLKHVQGVSLGVDQLTTSDAPDDQGSFRVRLSQTVVDRTGLAAKSPGTLTGDGTVRVSLWRWRSRLPGQAAGDPALVDVPLTGVDAQPGKTVVVPLAASATNSEKAVQLLGPDGTIREELKLKENGRYDFPAGEVAVTGRRAAVDPRLALCLPEHQLQPGVAGPGRAGAEPRAQPVPGAEGPRERARGAPGGRRRRAGGGGRLREQGGDQPGGRRRGGLRGERGDLQGGAERCAAHSRHGCPAVGGHAGSQHGLLLAPARLLLALVQPQGLELLRAGLVRGRGRTGRPDRGPGARPERGRSAHPVQRGGLGEHPQGAAGGAGTGPVRAPLLLDSAPVPLERRRAGGRGDAHARVRPRRRLHGRRPGHAAGLRSQHGRPGDPLGRRRGQLDAGGERRRALHGLGAERVGAAPPGRRGQRQPAPPRAGQWPGAPNPPAHPAGPDGAARGALLLGAAPGHAGGRRDRGAVGGLSGRRRLRPRRRVHGQALQRLGVAVPAGRAADGRRHQPLAAPDPRHLQHARHGGGLQVSVGARLRGVLLAGGLAAACAHGGPQPDPELVREALEAERCAAPDPPRGCPRDTFEPLRYVSARAYLHTLRAQAALRAGDPAGAVAALREALVYDPESAFLHTGLADALLLLGRVGDAEDELKRALQLDAAHAPAHVLLARISAARAKPEEARGHLEAAMQAAPSRPEAFRERVRLELLGDDLQAARAAAGRLERQAALLSARPAGARSAEELDPLGEELVLAERLRQGASDAWLDVARAALRLGVEEQAQQALERALAANPASADGWLLQTQAWELRARFPEALAAALRLLSLRPEAPEVVGVAARISLEAGDLEAMVVHVRRLLAMGVELEPAGADAGEAPGESGDRLQARRDLAALLLRTGVPLLGARRPGLALELFEEAARLAPGHPEPDFYRALALVQRGRVREGQGLLEEVALRLADAEHGAPPLLAQEPRSLSVDARVQSALARGRLGEAAEALRRLRELFDEEPLDEGVALGLLEGHDRAGRGAEALALLEARAALHPDVAGLLYALAAAQDRAGRLAETKGVLTRVLELAPAHAGALNHLGYLLVEEGGQAALLRAKPLLLHAVQLRPDDGAVADSYGRCLFRLGKVAPALAELRRADRLAPGDPVLLSHLGDALEASGLGAEAAATYERALGRLAPAATRRRGRKLEVLPDGEGIPTASPSAGTCRSASISKRGCGRSSPEPAP